MEKIRCPHCGAVNQDVTPQDNCWQCSKPLSAAPPNAATAPVTETRGTDGLPRAGQVQLTLEERVAARKAARKRTLTPQLTLAVVIALLLICLLVYFFVLKH